MKTVFWACVLVLLLPAVLWYLDVGLSAVFRPVNDHFFMTFSGDDPNDLNIDAGATPVILNAGSDAYTAQEMSGFSNSGDTVTYTGNNGHHIKFDISITFEATITIDFVFDLYNLTDSTVVPISSKVSGEGNNNHAQAVIIAYDKNATKNDRYILRVTNITNTTDLQVDRVMWFGRTIH